MSKKTILTTCLHERLVIRIFDLHQHANFMKRMLNLARKTRWPTLTWLSTSENTLFPLHSRSLVYLDLSLPVTTRTARSESPEMRRQLYLQLSPHLKSPATTTKYRGRRGDCTPKQNWGNQPQRGNTEHTCVLHSS